MSTQAVTVSLETLKDGQYTRALILKSKKMKTNI